MKGFLVLEDEKIFEGQFRGEPHQWACGEVVFNTSMQGYQEILSDPSYFGQIVVMTTPEQGNYGVIDEERESAKVQAEGFICLELNTSFTPGRKNLEDELRKFKKVALSGIDTRSLTLHLRERGTPWGAIVHSKSSHEAQDKARQLLKQVRSQIAEDWVYEVSTPKTIFHRGSGRQGRIAVYDFGTKSNIIEELKARFHEVAIFNSRASSKEVQDWDPDGLVLTNGPGDPATVKGAASEVQKILGQLPIMGICMGHQILALAVGAETYKLKFGHRGANHPVKNLATGEIYMTSQNHGYAVKKDLPKGVLLSQINLYDQTVEGIEIPSKKAWSVQYHPEANPGPHDSRGLFDHFKETLN